MRKSVWLTATAAAVLVAVGSAATVSAGEETAPAPATTNVVKHQTICPVLMGAIDKSLFVDYQGKRIYVCCNMCINTVKKDPAKYVKQLEAEGITLDKAEPAKR